MHRRPCCPTTLRKLIYFRVSDKNCQDKSNLLAEKHFLEGRAVPPGQVQPCWSEIFSIVFRSCGKILTNT